MSLEPPICQHCNRILSRYEQTRLVGGVCLCDACATLPPATVEGRPVPDAARAFEALANAILTELVPPIKRIADKLDAWIPSPLPPKGVSHSISETILVSPMRPVEPTTED